jgi:hypothetical protein
MPWKLCSPIAKDEVVAGEGALHINYIMTSINQEII